MPTFSFPADFVAERKNEPKVRRTSFADGGYEQRNRFGLNNNPKVFSLNFEGRSDVERDQILAFFDDEAGADSFDWVCSINDRRNLLTYTEDLSTSRYTRLNLTSVTSGLSGYYGGLNAFGLIANATSGLHELQRTITLASNFATSASIYAKAGISRNVRLYQYGTTEANIIDLNFNTGAVTNASTAGATTTSFGATRFGSSGWWRLWVTGTPGATTTRRITVGASNAAGTFSFAGDTSSTYITTMSPQIEAGSLTDYQPIIQDPRPEKYVCESYNTRYIGCNNNSISATFRQVFDL